MADNQAGIDIIARLDGFKSELAKIPDIGADEARKLTTALAKEIKQAEKAAKDAAKASKEQADALKRAGQAAKETTAEVSKAAAEVEHFGEAAGSTGSSVGKLAGALDLLAPGAGGAAMAVADLADVGEVAAAAAGALGVSLSTLAAVALPIAAIVAGVGLAWQSYSATAKEAAEFQERLNEALDGVDPIASRARDEIDKLRLNIGQLTEAQYDDNEIRKDFADQLDTGTAKLREERDALKAHMAEIGTANDEYLTLQDRLHEVNGLIDTATTLNEQGQDAALANADIARERAESEKVLAERLKKKAEAERAASKRTQEVADAARDHAEAMAAEQARLNAYQQAMDGLASLTAAAAQDTGKLAKMEADRAAQLTRLTDLEQQAVEQAMGNSAALEELDAASAAARKAIWADYYADVQAYHDELVKKATDDAEKVAQHEADVAAKVAASAVNSATSAMDALDQIAQTVQDRAEEQGADQARLAQVAFAVHKGAAIASAGVTTAKMALDAYAAALELGAPGLILAPIAAGAAVATGAAQVAAIASEPPPKFHSGGTVGPDEVAATLKRGEGVLSGQGVQAAGGAEGVRRLNAGQKPAEGPIVVQLGHKLFEAAARRNARLSGSILSQRARRLGHRSR